MAGIRQTFTVQIKNDAGQAATTDTAVVVGDAQEEFDLTVPGSGNVTLPLAVDVSAVVAFWVVCDKAVSMQENAADLLVELAAGVPYWWYTGRGPNPFSVDIASLKFTKADAGDAVVKGAFLTT